jgi:glycosyltransferase 2 family protein
MKPWAKKGVFWVRLLLPLLLFAVIFARIDFRELFIVLRGVRLDLALWGWVLGYIVPIFVCVLRWQLVLRRGYDLEVPFLYLLRQFWVGMFVGYLVPGGIGTDLYRIAALARKTGGFHKNAAAVVGEKVVVLLANGLLVMAAYPLIAALVSADEKVGRLIKLVYALGLAGWLGLALFALCGMLWKGAAGRLLARRLRRLEERAAVRSQASGSSGGDGLFDVLRPFFGWRLQLLVAAVTVGSQLIACYGGKLMVASVGVDLPLLVHVLVWNLMVFVFLAPISIGTLGVREGTFIVLFGLFGVAREASLAASFVGLASLLLTVALGGVIALATGWRQEGK